MKALIAITSCARDVINGNNQAIRDTWVKKLSLIREFDYKFFIGIASPKSINQELPDFQNSYHNLSSQLILPSIPLDRTALQGDEILLDAPDGYPYLPYKIRESRRWALNEGYDYIFKCDVDVFVHPMRLKYCGFENYDYMGSPSPLEGREAELLKALNYPLPGSYAGGVGYSLSRKACEAIVNAPINILAEDVWTGYNLYINGIYLHADYRFCYHVGEMDNTIAVHLSQGTDDYDNKKMSETSILFDRYRPVKPITVVKRIRTRPFRNR